MPIAIIPARYASSRFPGKPLIDIFGKSMLKRVYEQVSKFKLLRGIIIATEDQRIFDHASTFCEDVFMTSPNHQSGTDRCLEALELYREKYHAEPTLILNIQCDEPFIHPEQIAMLYHCFDKSETQISTIIKKIDKKDELQNPNVVKVIKNKMGKALYFSRQCIPFNRDINPTDWFKNATYFKHIGLYGYTVKTLRQITRLKVSELEAAEKLEQLRWLENGFEIQTAISNRDSNSIDRPEDLERLGLWY